MLSIIALVILLGIAVIFHEFGHFIVAKLLKIRVEQFSIGFPPRLFGIKLGETDYCVSALPLGGYVKVTGQDPTEELTGADYEYNSRPPWQRMLVVVAGPFMNLFIAYWLFVLALVIGIPTFSPVVDKVEPGTLIAKSGIVEGDVLSSINGKSVTSIDSFGSLLEENSGKSITVGIQRNKENLKYQLAIPRKIENIDQLGLDFKIPAVVGIVQPNKPAARAGIQLGDEIVSVNGVPSEGRWQNVTKAIRSGKGQEIHIVVKRKDQSLGFNLKPEYNGIEKAYLVGISAKPYSAGSIIRYPLGDSMYKAGIGVWTQIKMMGYAVSIIVTGKMPLKDALGGPQSIAQIAGQYIQFGLSYYLMFIAGISISLGLINLLPIPVLDGGHFLFYVIESIRRKPLSIKVWQVSTKMGFGLLLALMTYVILNDFIGSGVLSRILQLSR